MSQTILWRFLLTSALSFGLLPGAFAQEPPVRHEMRFLRGLDLTDVQRNQVFAILDAQAPAARERMQAARSAREELRRIALSEPFDAERARVLAEVEGNAVTELALMRAESMSKVRDVLTPEQRAKLGKLLTSTTAKPRQ